MVQMSAIQDELLCPSCAGQRVWDPRQRALTCQSCGSQDKLYRTQQTSGSAEIALDPDNPDAEQPDVSATRAHRCETCGGEVLFIGPALSDRCPYCDGPVVLGTEDTGYRAMAVIPFSLSMDEAKECARHWIDARWAAPGDLVNVIDTARIVGLYAPFWTFDSTEVVHYWAEYHHQGGWRADWRPISGSMPIEFDDVLVPASPHVTPLIRDGILHEFNPEHLEPYDVGYLSGFAAERHHQSVEEGLETDIPDRAVLIKNRVEQHLEHHRLKDINYLTDKTGMHYRRILLPVWILHYRYDGTPLKVVVSGIDGRTFGERPFSRSKLAVYSAYLCGAAILFGLSWGSLAAH